MKKRIFACLLTGCVTLASMAQISNTLSPYSQFGLGTLANQSQGFNRGMDGLAYGLRDNLPRSLAYCGMPYAKHLVDELLASPDAAMPGVIVFGDLSTIAAKDFAELRRRYP